MSSQFEKGQRVRHPLKNEWGVGLILDTDGLKAKIVFEDGFERTLLVQKANLQLLTEADAKSHILDELSQKKPKSIPAVRKTKARQPKYSFPHLLDKFLAFFPKGFYDEEYLTKERQYKIDACKLFGHTLNRTKLHFLLQEKKYSEVCTLAKRVIGATNLLFTNEIIALSNALKDHSSQKKFVESLYYSLYQETSVDDRFENFSECLLDLDADYWTIATYFLYLSEPSKYMFMKPQVTKIVADSFNFELNYRPQLNSLTYSCLHHLAEVLIKERLAELKPRDYIDVQSFIWSSVGIAEGTYGSMQSTSSLPESLTLQTVDLDVQAFARAFSELASELPQEYLEMLRAHYRAPKHMITASEMANAVGFKNYSGANLHYGRLAGILRDRFGMPVDDEVNISILVTFIMPGETGNEEIIWVLKPEVVAALEKLKWT